MGDVVRRKAIEEQGVKEKKQLQRCREDKECERAKGFLVASVISEKLCGDDGLCPKQQQQQHEEGFLTEEMPAEDDCRKKRCVDRYDSSESSDRYVVKEFVDTMPGESSTGLRYLSTTSKCGWLQDLAADVKIFTSALI